MLTVTGRLLLPPNPMIAIGGHSSVQYLLERLLPRASSSLCAYVPPAEHTLAVLRVWRRPAEAALGDLSEVSAGGDPG